MEEEHVTVLLRIVASAILRIKEEQQGHFCKPQVADQANCVRQGVSEGRHFGMSCWGSCFDKSALMRRTWKSQRNS
eukprot:scaffold763_cov98-Cylindrotheca_fusiformis.AAC.10